MTESPAVECLCECHVAGSTVMHITACCEGICSKCGKHFKCGLDEHAAACRMGEALRPLSLDDVVAKVQSGRFTFSRWGDGEWHAVLGRAQGQNCDKHPYRPELTMDLRKVLEARPGYTLGMQPLAQRVMGGRINAWLAERGLSDLPWWNSDVLHHANKNRRLRPLIHEINTRYEVRIGIGPRHLGPVFEALGWVHIVVGGPDSYINRDWLHAAEYVVEHATVTPFVSISSGPPGKIAVDKLHRIRNGDICLIDFGSVFDPYGGSKSRGYMRNDAKPYDVTDLV